MTRSTSTTDVLKRLRAAGSAANVAGMARYGIRPAKAYGVATPVIRAIAKDHRFYLKSLCPVEIPGDPPLLQADWWFPRWCWPTPPPKPASWR